MTATLVNTDRRWSQAFVRNAQPFDHCSLNVIEGSVPTSLRGTLYQVGAACFERGHQGGAAQGRQRVAHWFDGDGAVLAIAFTEHDVSGLYQYVETAGRVLETKADRYLLPSYAMTAAGPIWQRWGKPLRNAANTSILVLPDRILALWEGGEPYALSKADLQTLGPDYLGALKPGATYSAHYKQDLATGEIFNFGLGLGLNASLNLYVSDSTGQIQRRGSSPLQGVPLIHDFVLAGDYLVFCIPPVRLELLPAGLGFKSFSDALAWRPELGTEIVICDRHTLKLVSRKRVDPWFQWHFGNGYVNEANQLVLDLIRYEDFQTNQYLKEVVSGQIQTSAQGNLWRCWLDPQTATLQNSQFLTQKGAEFPVIAPQFTGQPAPQTYFVTHNDDAELPAELFGAIACHDQQTGQQTEFSFGPHRYPAGLIYAQSSSDSEQHWLLTVVFDGEKLASEVWIFAGGVIEAGPVCKIALPEVVPFGFHGVWDAA
ncbi:MAG: carotenoid oxygenase family protein [Cyanobacteria bacterium P01_H01_bin.121]